MADIQNYSVSVDASGDVTITGRIIGPNGQVLGDFTGPHKLKLLSELAQMPSDVKLRMLMEGGITAIGLLMNKVS